MPFLRADFRPCKAFPKPVAGYVSAIFLTRAYWKLVDWGRGIWDPWSEFHVW